MSNGGVFRKIAGSPLGNLLITANQHALLQVSFINDIPEGFVPDDSSPVIRETLRQLNLYFNKQLTQFQLPVNTALTGFQNDVLEQVQKIPYGQTVTYTQLAQRMGSVKKVRAVAAANAANPLLIVIPCHRIVGKNSSLTGYAGELWRKEWLLKHENSLPMPLFS